MCTRSAAVRPTVPFASAALILAKVCAVDKHLLREITPKDGKWAGREGRHRAARQPREMACGKIARRHPSRGSDLVVVTFL